MEFVNFKLKKKSHFLSDFIPNSTKYNLIDIERLAQNKEIKFNEIENLVFYRITKLKMEYKKRHKFYGTLTTGMTIEMSYGH